MSKNTTYPLDPFHLALIAFRQNKTTLTINLCDQVLGRNAQDQSAWALKARAMTNRVWVDDLAQDDAAVTDALDNDLISSAPRPGTSLVSGGASGTGGASSSQSQAIRPRTQSGRPVSGVTRPMTRPGTTLGGQMQGVDRAGRTARPVSTTTGRFVRLGTASLATGLDGSAPLVNLSRLNVNKYANEPTLGRILFEYIYYVLNDVRTAMKLAAVSTQAAKYQHIYWKQALAKCYYRLGLYRDAEKQLRSAVQQQPNLDDLLFLGKLYERLDQPLTAIEWYNRGLDTFQSAESAPDVSLLTALARIHEALNDERVSLRYYKKVLEEDSANVEAVACIGAHHFYADTPELAIAYYRRLLAMGVKGAELYANLGLCCFYAHQLDLAIGCLERAVSCADDSVAGDVWYDLSHVAVGCGDVSLAHQCLRLALASTPSHPEAYNNLAILSLRQGKRQQAKVLLQASIDAGSYNYEPFYNLALLQFSNGEYHDSLAAIKQALELYPGHADSKELHRRLANLVTMI